MDQITSGPKLPNLVSTWKYKLIFVIHIASNKINVGIKYI